MVSSTNNPPIAHPTQYSSLSDIEVKSLFASNSWNSLSPQCRLNACQEIENRLAAERGTDSRLVFDKPMEGKTFGFQSGNYIAVNSHLLEKSTFQVEHIDFMGNAHTVSVPVNAPSWEILSTIYHEDTHGMWEDQGIMPQTYIKPETSDLLYYLQGCEKAAFLNEEKLTLQAIKEVSQYNKKIDPQALIYIEGHSANSYREILKEAQTLFNDPDIEQTLNQYIDDNDKGIIPQHPSQSYISIDNLYIQQNIRSYFGNQPFRENELNSNLQNLNLEVNNQTPQLPEQTNNLYTTNNDNHRVNTAENDGATISHNTTMGITSIENDGATIDFANCVENSNDGYSVANSDYSSSYSDGGYSNNDGQSIE